MVTRALISLGGIPTTGTRAWKVKIPSLGCFPRGGNTPLGYSTRWVVGAQRGWNAGITSRANQRSCSLNSFAGRPSAQWLMTSSRPGYLAAIDLITSITCDGGLQNHA